MTIQRKSSIKLLSTIENDQFFQVSEDEILHQIQEAFSPELERLKNAYAVERSTPPTIPLNGSKPHRSPSDIVFGEDYDEVNRTLVGVLALRWIHNNDYERFTTGQIPKMRLHRESFNWLRDYFQEHIKSHEDLFALILSMIVNDLGKDPNMVEDYYERTNKALTGENHDTILLEAAHIGLVPCLDLLDEEHRRDVMLGLELGSELNAGQLAQAENVPINLEGLLGMRDNEHAFDLKFMEQVLDVSGAAGHIRSDGAKNLIEPVFQAFKTVYEVSLNIINRRCTLRQGYDQVLTKRGNMLHDKGYRRLSVSDRSERALLRLLAMGRTASVDQAELFEQAFAELDDENKKLLVDGLNVDGDINETAVLPYYMPAMLSESLENTKDSPTRVEALTSLMRYLARVLRWTDNEITGLPQVQEGLPWEAPDSQAVPGVVIERNMMQARETISSQEFKLNPNVLDNLEAPVGHVMPRRRTSQSL